MRRLNAVLLSLFVISPAAANADRWTFKVTTNPIDDTVQAVANLHGDNIALAMSCDTRPPADEMYAEINLGQYVDPAGYDFVYRVDKKPAVYGNWRDKFDGRNSIVQLHGRATNRDFVDAISVGKTLTVQAELYDEDAKPIIRTIDLSGAKEIIARLKAKCLNTKVAAN